MKTIKVMLGFLAVEAFFFVLKPYLGQAGTAILWGIGIIALVIAGTAIYRFCKQIKADNFFDDD
ncbi:MAG: hypothetical protein KGL39_33250 [Patescibacteria group bacterium]|nr:hypothetical protein [Patescibacteria group bacterium]